MNNKVLVNIYVPSIDKSYDLFIPVNEVIWKITKLCIKSISDIENIELSIKDNYVLINKTTSKVYGVNEIVIETDIRNETELILVKIK
jgi:hypothetical protein